MSWKVYIPSKHARFGIKSLELCEAKSGYVWNFIVYVGQDIAFDETLKNEPYGSEVVLDLMVPLLKQGYYVTMNSWFSSPYFYDKLCSKRIDAMSTLLQSRKVVPVERKKEKFIIGVHISMFKDILMLIKWKDKKDVCLISTTHDDEMVSARARGKDIMKPKIIVNYN